MRQVHKVRLRYNPRKGWSYWKNKNYFKDWFNAFYMADMFREDR